MRPISTILLLLLLHSFLQAQKATKLISQVNAHVTSIPNGYFDNRWMNKYLTSTDTSRADTRIYFFRDKALDDTLSLFVTRDTGGVFFAYDGDRVYYVNRGKKEITYKELNGQEGVVKSISGNTMRSNSIFLPYLFHAPGKNFTQDKYESAAVKKGKKGSTQLIKKENFVNPLKSLPTDPDSGRYQMVLSFEKPGPQLVDMAETVWINDMVQYRHFSFSRIHPLPAKEGFSDYFNLGEYEKDGYVVRSLEPYLEQKTTLVQPGGKVPEFDLPTGLESAPRLVLLDFWYMSCGPCILSLPHIDTLYQSYKAKGLLVLGVNKSDKDQEKARAFLKKRGGSYSTVFDEAVHLIQPLGVRAYPSVVLFDPVSREVLYVHEGFGESSIQALREILDVRLR